MITYEKHNALNDALRFVRTKVFIDEQGFENEFDDIDFACTHLLFFVDGSPAGCLRYFKEGGEYHIGRVAVLPEFRDRHIGSLMMEKAEDEIRREGGKSIFVSAQCRVREFYEKSGYKALGDVYYDEFCPHIKMEKIL